MTRWHVLDDSSGTFWTDTNTSTRQQIGIRPSSRLRSAKPDGVLHSGCLLSARGQLQ